MRIKETCEDFLVDEVLDTSILSSTATMHHLYLLKKKNYTTERAVAHIAKALHIPRKYISYAGTKDKQAITTQYITISGAKKEHVAKLDLKDIALTFTGYAQQKLTLGNLQGNTFTITLYEPDHVPTQLPKTFFVPNYFDDQRFSKHNVTLGQYILQKQFKEAVDLLLTSDEDFALAIQEHLKKHPNDYIGSLRLLPGKTLLFYVHAVQSLLFNRLLAQEITDGFSVPYSQGELAFPRTLPEELSVAEQTKTLPLLGYDSELTLTQEQSLALIGLTPRDFLVKSIPQLSLAGDARAAFMLVSDCNILQQEQDRITLSFTLPKGCYATIVLKQLFAKR
jgi:tRNA pseudouridine13 synthase